MGFDHAELMVVGHFSRVVPPQHISTMPFNPPNGLHFEKWFHTRGEPGEARRLWEEALMAKAYALHRHGTQRFLLRGIQRPG